MSIVEANRRQLQAVGEYVTRAKIDWFALFPEKLASIRKIASELGREPNLIVYKKHRDLPRDHYVIPLADIGHLLTDDTLTLASDETKRTRWNVTLKSDKLRVSHSEDSYDASHCFGGALAFEVIETSRDVQTSIDLRASGRVPTSILRVIRDTSLSASLKQLHANTCQLCRTRLPLSGSHFYSEAHHIQPLGSPHDGPDIAENMIVLCPNCHTRCDYCAFRFEPESIHTVAGHHIERRFIDYHNALYDKIAGG